ncbi:MFS transporter [Actinomadura harenae]|uniref:MFS transporter n=1 Tax=Actinomadura harenae TaxID=2483351 RepID=A0A3M2M5W7_9ACTN|nr:MFS transporter [Actinomadura harenae]
MSRARRPLAYGAGNLGVQLLAQTFTNYATFYYVDRLGLNAALVGAVMIASGAALAILNPVIGHLSDRTRTRWGRRVPYIAAGTLPLAVVSAAIWAPPFHGHTALLWYFLVTVLVFDLLTITVVLNYGALFPEMFRTTRERAAVAPARQLFGIAGMILGVAGAPLLYGSIGWPAMGACFALLAAASLALSLHGSVERADVPHASFGFTAAVRYTLANRAFVTYAVGGLLLQLAMAIFQGGLPFYTEYALGLGDAANTAILGSLFAAAIPTLFVWGRLITRWGPRSAVLAATAVLAAALLPFLGASGLPAAMATGALVGVGAAGVMVLLEVLLADVIDDDTARTGARREGMYTGMNGFVVRWGTSLQAVLISGVLGASGYHAGAGHQPGSVDTGVRLLLGAVPIAVLLLAAASFLLYPLRDRTRAVSMAVEPVGEAG